MHEQGAAGVRIGELSRRVGVSVDVLRAWERRYGVLRPARTHAGQRLYSDADEARVRHMQRHIASGYTPQVAARLVDGDGAAAPGAGPAPPPGPQAADALFERLTELDDAGAQARIDRLVAGFSLDAVLGDVVLPVLRRIGDAWAAGEITVAQEHFAANVVGSRLRALARGWDRGLGPRALVGCVAGEQHDLGALCFALALRERGWRITWLGTDVPVDALRETADRLEPDLVVLAAARREPLALVDPGVAAVAARHPTALGGAGATAAVAERLGARLLPDDAIAAADALAGGAPARDPA